MLSRIFIPLSLLMLMLQPVPCVADQDTRRTPVVLALEKVGPAVVNIRTEQVVQRRSSPFFGFGGDLFEDFFGEFGPSRIYTSQSLGSGVLIDPRGFVLTNAHVVDKASKVYVALPDKIKEIEADLVGQDRRLDLAVLRIRGEQRYPSVPLGSSSDLMLGETVIAVGNPLGLGHSITTGVVSTSSRRLPTEDGNLSVFVQSDALINPGNSGGPLLNLDGELVGINTAIARQAQGIGFAIPSDIVKRVLEDLIKHGEVRPGIIGVIPGEVGRAFTRARGSGGVLVTDLYVQGPAKKAGLIVADVIVGLDGVSVNTVKEYLALLGTYPPGSRINVDFLRGTESKRLKVEVQDIPEGYVQDYARKVFGFSVKDSRKGLVVDQVVENGSAAQAGLRTGDRVVKVGGAEVKRVDDFETLLKNNLGVYPVNFLIVRGNNGYYVDLP